ncbi:sigma-54 dependent transcriptional regulator [Lysobacter sp. TY2-98]|uniref:sigma-54-dependent transcriptional regulator n=1 Tax=Lysobacter sp. TY2-98 TaxID=2290922 RepID=UPI0013B35988|nr:sigma-54 dependent transcriptional regulator [Lysobacter sp. TY2-98]
MADTPHQPSLPIADGGTALTSAAVDFARAQGVQASVAHSLEESRRATARGAKGATAQDVTLPDGTTFDLLAELDTRQRSRAAVASGETSLEASRRAAEPAVADYAPKPLYPPKFESVLSQASARALAQIASARPDGMIGDCDAMRQLAVDLDRVAPTSVSVLITGESGTGKELVARAVHDRSRRRGSFIAVNCGAIAPDLLASHLFGHERGSFTGAQQRHVGFFEQAHRGTLFLDEITEMPPALQVYLLRVLETGEVTRVGGSETIPVDVRIVAATNREPIQSIEQGKLREDLYYRLADFVIALPPLRARGSDVVLLANVFVERLNAEHGQAKQLAPDAERMLVRHGWPGNIRELRSVVQRAYLLSDGPLVRIPVLGRRAMPLHQDDSSIVFHVGMSYADVEREMLLKTLAKVDGDKTEAARVLGVSVRTIHNQLARLATGEDASHA